MAVWTNIANTQVEADAPITTDLMQSLRDNVTALAEGASGAPQIQTAAIGAAQVTQAKMATDSVGSAQIIANSINVSQMNFQTRIYSGTIVAGQSLTFPCDTHMLVPRFQYGSGPSRFLTMIYTSSVSPNTIQDIVLTNTDISNHSYLLTWYYLT